MCIAPPLHVAFGSLVGILAWQNVNVQKEIYIFLRRKNAQFLLARLPKSIFNSPKLRCAKANIIVSFGQGMPDI
jgi:hypothetical protein